MSNNKNETNVFNKSILNTQVRQDLEMERTDHMAYLPDMEVLDSGIDRQVLSMMESYDPASYTADDVKAALNHDMRGPEDFAALLSPAAQPLLEEIARKVFGRNRTESTERDKKTFWQLRPNVHTHLYCQLLRKLLYLLWV